MDEAPGFGKRSSQRGWRRRRGRAPSVAAGQSGGGGDGFGGGALGGADAGVVRRAPSAPRAKAAGIPVDTVGGIR